MADIFRDDNSVPGAAGSSASSTPEQKDLGDGDAEKQSADLTSRKPDDIVDWCDAHGV